MIGLDSNVLVRYLTADDAAQFTRARMLIEQELTEQDPGFVSVVAMAETVWVLERSYRLSPGQLVGGIQRILQADALVVEAAPQVFTAMRALELGLGSFGDALIGLLGDKAGCSHTLSFDVKASRLPWFSSL